MTLVYACIAPHGGELVPRLAGRQLKLFAPTRRGMRALAAQLRAAAPETIVVASPHNLRLDRHIGLVLSENSTGEVVEGKHRIRLSTRCDLEFGRRVLRAAETLGLPVVGANYGALEGSASNLAMDWGTLIPLWFFLRGGREKSRVLILTPSRGIPLEQNFEFGKVVGKAAESEKKRIAFVASADQAHAHRKDGPYGFSREAAVYDEKVVEAVSENRLSSLMTMDSTIVDAAKPDSLWQLAMLAGILDVVQMRGRLFSYQVPTYFGMLCAGYSPLHRAPR